MIPAIILFGILILTHELGHYLAARWAGITVLEFSIGMGPTLYAWESGGTRYSLRLLPIGGFVKMEGEDPDPQQESSVPTWYEPQTDAMAPADKPERSTKRFNEVPIGRRAIVLAAGAIMNLLCALIAMVVLVASDGVIASTTVDAYREENISAAYGLLPGDTIVKVNGRRIHISSDLVYTLLDAGEEPVELTVRRGGQTVLLQGVRFPTDSGQQLPDFYCTRAPFNPLTIVREAFFRCTTIMREVYGAFAGMLTGKVSVDDLSGPVGTTQVISQAAGMGLWQLTYLAIFISINLGIFNLLPFPALDGGRLLFLLIEKLRGKPIRPEIEGMLNLAGFALLMLLVVVVTFKDVAKLFGGG